MRSNRILFVLVLVLVLVNQNFIGTSTRTTTRTTTMALGRASPPEFRPSRTLECGRHRGRPYFAEFHISDSEVQR